MTPEQKFYQWFRKQLPPGADCVRIENTVGGGMPDVNVCWRGIELWIELKVHMRGLVLLRPDQFAWLNRRAAASGRVFVVAKMDVDFYVWKFPHTEVVQYTKYLSLGGPKIMDRNHLINFLFT